MGCCNDFTRAQLLRQSAAVAGKGLPAVEPGMPEPAGTGLTRRAMLLRSAGLALSVYGAGKLLAPQAFEEGIAQALSGPAQPVIVSIFMPGGIDGLNVLAPVYDPRYAQLRPTLGLTEAGTLPVTGAADLRWHPAATGLKSLHDSGKVTVCPAIGYDHPDQSHFTSRHFWEVGELDANARTGWLGRYLDVAGQPNNPIQGLSLDYTLSPTLATKTVAVAAVASPTSYTFDSPGVWNATVRSSMLTELGALGGLATGDPVLAQARQAQANASVLRGQLATPLSATPGSVTYPANNALATSLRSLGQLLGAGLPLRCVTANANGGFDTHSGQPDQLTQNLQSTCDAIAAFQADLEARGGGLADRVLIHLWSEFGRRPGENGSLGTDHGAGGVSFVIGTKASGQMIGEFPGLATLDPQGNLRNTSDFRAVYCSLLEQWLDTDATDVIPGAATLARPQLVT